MNARLFESWIVLKNYKSFTKKETYFHDFIWPLIYNFSLLEDTPKFTCIMHTFVRWTTEVLYGFAKKKIKWHVSCLFVCIVGGKSNFDCPACKYPVYELLYRSVPSPFFKIYNAMYIHYIRFSLGKKAVFMAARERSWGKEEKKWRNCRLTTKM